PTSVFIGFHPWLRYLSYTSRLHNCRASGARIPPRLRVSALMAPRHPFKVRGSRFPACPPVSLYPSAFSLQPVVVPRAPLRLWKSVSIRVHPWFETFRLPAFSISAFFLLRVNSRNSRKPCLLFPPRFAPSASSRSKSAFRVPRSAFFHGLF